MIDGIFFQGQTPEDLAHLRSCSRSTIYNNKAKATHNMERDDCFFAALFRLGILRDQTHAEEIRRRYPDGRHAERAADRPDRRGSVGDERLV